LISNENGEEKEERCLKGKPEILVPDNARGDIDH
jgi:hypothetical protein